MAQRCPECGTAVDATPWCGACGARLADAPDASAPSGRAGSRMALRVAAAVAAVVVGIVVLSRGSPDRDVVDGAPDGPTSVEEAAVLPPALPSPGSAVNRQFAAESAVLWERTDVPGTASDAADLGLVAEGEVVAVTTSAGPVLTVAVSSGQDVAAPAPSSSPADLQFSTAEGTVAVTAGTMTTLEGTVGGAAAWTIVLEAPLAVAPIRSGPTVVVGLADDTVAAYGPLRGEQRWRQDLGVLPTALAGDGTMLLVGTADGRVLRLDPEGRTVTSTDLGQGPVLSLVAGRPAVALLVDRLVGLDVDG